MICRGYLGLDMPEDRSVGQGLSNFIMCQEKLGKTKIGWEGGRERKKGGKRNRDYGVSCPETLLTSVFFKSFIIIL